MDLLLPEQGSLVVEPRQRTWRPTRRGRWMIGVTSCSVLVAVVGYLAVDQVQQRNQFDHSQAALSGTQQHISAVAEQLADLQHDLLVVTTQVGNDTTAFDQDASQLKGAQTALGAAQTHVTQQTSLITSLQTCLGGVEQALNALAVDDRLRAFALLESVSSSCTTAAAASG
jgi:hypothetical protein